MKNLLLTIVASIIFASAALAGNPAPISPVIPVVVPATTNTGADWGGFYLGATFGTGVGGNMAYSTGATYATLEPGQSYGVFAGYNVQRNNLVFGGELAYSAVNTPGFGPGGFPNETFDYFADGKVRVGFAMNKALVYGFAGYSASHFTFVSGANHSVSGLNYGAGVDYMVGSRFFVGAEYIVRELEGTTTSLNTHTANIQEVQLRAGIKF